MISKGMAIDRKSRAAAVRALHAGVPFALYCLPEEEHARFIAAREYRHGSDSSHDREYGRDKNCDSFDISPWLGRFGSRISIPAELLSLIHISEHTRLGMISDEVLC